MSIKVNTFARRRHARSTIRNNKLNMQGEKLEISAKLGVFVLHISLLPLVKAARYGFLFLVLCGP